MTRTSKSIRRFGQLAYPTQVDIDEICDWFEAEFKAGRRPDAGDFLSRVNADTREALAGELIAIELHYRVDEEHSVRDSYARWFPNGIPTTESSHVTLGSGQSLESGTELGDFRIERQVGQGGMGVVYAARDVKLGRQVALKFLPTQFAEDQQRLDRFQREAKILASLNHPNIATLHGFAEDAGWCFCVMEYVTGLTLGEILRQRRLPLRECVSIFIQIAEALESAHEAGIVHRDLKPANVKVTPEGLVKVLDFGLAKSLASVPLDPDAHADQESTGAGGDPTSKDKADTSRTGVTRTQVTGISGTLPYMSPEQTQGKPVDKRSDIWSYGCCLYETLSGTRAFASSETEDVIQAINKDSPDWDALPEDIPLPLERLLRRCLEKDPRQRLRDIGDARIELESLRDADPHVAFTKKPKFKGRAIRATRLIGLTAVITIALTVAALLSWLPRNIEVREQRSSVNLPSGLKLAGRVSIALSPVGDQIVFAASGDDGIPHLYLRNLDRFNAVKLEGTEFAESPFFSPDGRRIAFFTKDSIKTISVSGGSPTVVCRGGFFAGGCWTAEHGIIFCWDWGRELARVSPDGGKIRIRRDGRCRMGWPQLLPNGQVMLLSHGKAFVISATPSMDETVQSPFQALDLGRRVQYARYQSDGYLLYAHNGSLFSVPLELDPPRVAGDEVLIADDLMTYASAADCAISQNGDILYVPGGPTHIGELVWAFRDGTTEVAWNGSREYSSFQLSPTGEQVAIGVTDDDGTSVWIYDSQYQTKALLTTDGASERPIWSSDGKSIVFRWTRDGKSGLYRATPGWQEPPELLTSRNMTTTPVCFNRAGDRLICYSSDMDGHARSCILEIDLATGAETPLLSSPDQNEAFGDLSSDDKWLVYLSSKANRDYEVFVGRYPEMVDTHRVWHATLAEGQHRRLDPMWCPTDDNTIFFWDGGLPYGQVMEAKVKLEPRFEVLSIQQAVAETSIDLPGYAFDYDAVNDRFLLVRPERKVEPATEIKWLTNAIGVNPNSAK